MKDSDPNELNSTACLKVRWSREAALPDAIAVRIRDGVLPMLLVPRVRVRILADKGLSCIELFVLKSVLKHKKLNQADLENATGISSGPLRVLLNRLACLGLLNHVEGGFTAQREHAEMSVETGNCPQEVECTRNFVYLPSTGDLGNLSDRDFGKLGSLTPLLSGPVPSEQQRRLVKEVLQEASERSGRDFKIIDVESPLTVPEVCPAFAFKGDLKQSGTDELRLSFRATDPAAADDYYYFDFSFAHGFVETLLSLSRMRPDSDKVEAVTQRYLPQGGSMKNLSFPAPASPSRISMPMSLDVIQRIYPRRLLNTRAAMIVHWETVEAVVGLENSVQFLPSSKLEATQFARDRVVQKVCTNGSDPNITLARWIKQACVEFESAEGEVTKQSILDRLWELKRFVSAYLLQAEGIFDYDKATRHRCD